VRFLGKSVTNDPIPLLVLVNPFKASTVRGAPHPGVGFGSVVLIVPVCAERLVRIRHNDANKVEILLMMVRF
jgi:hypothetical protein